MPKRFSIFLLVFFVVSAACSVYGQYCEDEYDVPFVPTRMKIVEEMLRIADVNGNDILYDLGCGDGRIVITAAKKFGTRGTGIDIDPVRIAESMENAEKEGVTDKVRFIEQNLFDAEIGEATVVTLYLLPSVNLKLRPILFRDLKPGTRIVSHDFDMGDWAPDQKTVLDNPNDSQYSFGNHTVYFWTLPANVSGTWEWSADNKSYSLQLKQEFQVVYGSLVDGGTSVTIQNVVVSGSNLQFTTEVEVAERTTVHTYQGTVDNNTIEGTIESTTGTGAVESPWKARRDPSTIVPLDSTEIE